MDARWFTCPDAALDPSAWDGHTPAAWEHDIAAAGGQRVVTDGTAEWTVHVTAEAAVLDAFAARDDVTAIATSTARDRLNAILDTAFTERDVDARYRPAEV